MGCLVAGVCEIYYMMDADVTKCSNMQLTLLSRSLDIAESHLQCLGLQVPSHLVIQQDNTCREGRNQHVLAWGTKLLLDQKFVSVTFSYLQVGHTHLDLDQRFSVVGSTLARQVVLQVPQELWAALQHSSMVCLLASLPCGFHAGWCGSCCV